jgi:succinate dehydrogenase / fumarate reductase cytochrome b subunit
MGNFFNSSIGRKVSMALSAIFLMIFLLQHFAINFTSVVSPDLFNELSHFMGTNPLVQFVLQPVLIFGVVFHFVMGFILELKNRKASSLKYAKNNGAANSSWMSRNMIWSGLAILSFMLLHFVDFWFPELNYKYFAANPEDPTRYFHELQDKFTYAPRVIAYVIAFVFLSLHLLHGFTSALQSLGSTLGRKKILIKISYIYSLALPLGFIYIALFHYFTQH